MNYLKFNNSFAALGDEFFTRLAPTGLPEPYLITVNHAALLLLGLPSQTDHSLLLPDWLAEWCNGNSIIEGSDPLAMVYSGHQLGVTLHN